MKTRFEFSDWLMSLYFQYEDWLITKGWKLLLSVGVVVASAVLFVLLGK